MSFNADMLYVDRTAEDDVPHCAVCNVVLDFARDGIFQRGDLLLCCDCWLLGFDAALARSAARASGAGVEPALREAAAR